MVCLGYSRVYINGATFRGIAGVVALSMRAILGDSNTNVGVDWVFFIHKIYVDQPPLTQPYP